MVAVAVGEYFVSHVQHASSTKIILMSFVIMISEGNEKVHE